MQQQQISYEATEDQLKRIGEALKVSPALVITDLAGTIVTDKAVVSYLESKKYDWMTVLNNGEILFNINVSLADRNARMRELINLENVVQRAGLTPLKRPSTLKVISFVQSKNDNLAGEPGHGFRSHKNELNNVVSLITDKTDSDVQQLLDNLIESADRVRVSDIHIETNELTNSATIKYRIDGRLEVQTAPALSWSEQQAARLASMIVGYKAHTGGGTSKEPFNKNQPNDASLTVQTLGRKVKLRYSHLPTSDPKGLSIVLRIVTGDGDGKIPTYKELGYSEYEQLLQERSFQFPHGIVLYTGPTGSGKSSAMAAGTQTLPKTFKIISYEDPVEANLPNVCQVQVGNTEATSLGAYSRTALRQDPDVIIYGEIRDSVIMREAINQANTGHLVLSTLHTNTAADSIQRLVDLGCDWDVLTHPSLIRAVIGQRLVRRICDKCSVPLSQALKSDWATNDHYRVFNYFNESQPEIVKNIKTKNLGNVDCKHCNNNREVGRLPLVEIIIMDKKGRDFIKKRDLDGWISYLKKMGWQDLREKAILKIGEGYVCPISAEKILDSAFGMNIDSFNYDEFFDNYRVQKLQKENCIY